MKEDGISVAVKLLDDLVVTVRFNEDTVREAVIFVKS